MRQTAGKDKAQLNTGTNESMTDQTRSNLTESRFQQLYSAVKQTPKDSRESCFPLLLPVHSLCEP
jgi:hypothetical protein